MKMIIFGPEERRKLNCQDFCKIGGLKIRDRCETISQRTITNKPVYMNYRLGSIHSKKPVLKSSNSKLLSIIQINAKTTKHSNQNSYAYINKIRK